MIPRLIEQGGWVLLAIFALSSMAWTLIILKWIQVARDRAGGWAWTESMLRLLRDGDAAGAMTICREQPNSAGRLAGAAIGAGEPERHFFERFIQPALHSCELELQGYLPLAGVIGAASTLMGLLGTVLGMVTTFRALTTAGSSVTSTELASGISQALVTTQAGLVAALPIVFAHRVLHSIIRRHVTRIQLLIKSIETIRCHD